MAREDEFREFASTRYGALVRTAYLLTGDRGHAEDLAQSAMVRTYLAWGRLRAPEDAEAYARRTLVRLVTRSRQRRWRHEMPAGQVTEAFPGPVPAASTVIDGALDVRRALAALPAGQREVLVLRFLDDRSEAETAALLGISLGAVKSRTSRGLASMRQAGLLSVE